MSTNEELYVSDDMIKAHKKLEAKKKKEAKNKKEESKQKNAEAKKKREKDGKILKVEKVPQEVKYMESFSELKCHSCGPIDKYVLTGTARTQRIVSIQGEVLDQTTFWDTFTKDKYRCMVCGDIVSGKVV